MNVATFKIEGGSVVASICCDPKRDGSYDLKLWETGANQVVSLWQGNFINLDDDDYPLPKPNGANQGRMLQCLAVVAVPLKGKPALVSLVVSQDGEQLGRADRLVAPGSEDRPVNLWLELRGK